MISEISTMSTFKESEFVPRQIGERRPYGVNNRVVPTSFANIIIVDDRSEDDGSDTEEFDPQREIFPDGQQIIEEEEKLQDLPTCPAFSENFAPLKEKKNLKIMSAVIEDKSSHLRILPKLKTHSCKNL